MDSVMSRVFKLLIRNIELQILFDPNQPRDEKGRWVATGGRGFIAAAVKSGGFSYQPVTGLSPTTGCMVSLDSKDGFEHSFKIPDGTEAQKTRAIRDEFKKYVKKHLKTFQDNADLYCGGWVEDGVFCFDVSQNLPSTDMKKVVQTAKDRNQRGLYNIDTGNYVLEADYDSYLTTNQRRFVVAKAKQNFTYVRPDVDIRDPDITEDELEAALEKMSEHFVDAVLGKKHDWNSINKELSNMKK